MRRSSSSIQFADWGSDERLESGAKQSVEVTPAYLPLSTVNRRLDAAHECLKSA